MTVSSINDQMVLIAGESATGKSASLMGIPIAEHPRWLYCNCEAGKKLPFRNKFHSEVILDPYEVYQAFDHVRHNANYDGIIIDTITFLMDMQESLHVLGSNDTQAAWGEYAQFFKRMLQQYAAASDKAVIFLGHTRSTYDEKAMAYHSSVPIKGSLKNTGVESYFSTVVASKKIPINDLMGQDPNLLHITPEDEALGYKHVFQTRLTKATVGERIRSPMGMFAPNQTFIDNDAYRLLKHLQDFYA